MAKLLKLRRGTTTQHGSFTGAEGEVTIDTTKDTAVVHDGSTAGGRPLARQDMNNVPAGTILGTQLENSGVSAGQYGSSSAIPIVTVDAQGLVTAASTTAIDSTTIANGTSSVAVANNGDITTTRSGTARFVVDNGGVVVTGGATISGSLNSGDVTLTSTQPKIVFNDSNDNPDYQIENVQGVFKIRDNTNSADRLVVNTDGHVDVTGNLDVGAGIDVTGTVKALGALHVGSGNDFQVTRSSGNTEIQNYSGTLLIGNASSNSNNIFFRARADENSIECIPDGAVKLYHDGGGVKFETSSTGATVTGNLAVTGTVDGVNIAVRDTLFGNLTTNNGVLKNGVTATTQAASDNSTKVATTAYVTTGIANAQAFPSGTKMIFQQTSAPTGWTKVTSDVNNRALRVVSGTAGSGGSNAFTNTLASRGITANAGNTTATGNISVANGTGGGSVSIANATTGGTVTNHTLSTSEMPSHSHSYTAISQNMRYSGGSNAAFGNSSYNASTGGAGGSSSHSHGFTGSSHNHNANFTGNAHNHNASFSGSAHNHNISVTNLDMAVQYLDVIIASKD